MEVTRGTLPTLLLLLLFIGDCGGVSITKCYGDWYSGIYAYAPKLECTSPAVISLVGGSYGVSTCSNGANCCPDQSVCTVVMTDTDTDMQDIRTKCNGLQECPSDVRAGRKDNIICGSGGGLRTSNYVIINYDCLIDGSTPSPTPELTTDGSTTPPTGSTTPNNSTTSPTPPPKGGLSAGAIVGIVFGVILGILLILLIIFAVLVRRKNPNWPQTHNWQEPFRDYKSYIPDRVTSVVNRMTRRPDEDSKPDVTVTDSSKTYQDTSRNYQDSVMLRGNHGNHGNQHQPQVSLQQSNPAYNDVTLHAVTSDDRPNSTASAGVQIVRTPQDAIDESAGVATGIEDEPMYETIDDFQRGGSMYSMRSYDSFESIPMEDNDAYDRGASQKASPNKMKINDAIYYGALEGNKGTNLQAQSGSYDKPSDRGSAIPASPKVGRMTNVAAGAKPEEAKPSSTLPPKSSPKPGYKTVIPKSGLKPAPPSSKPPPSPQPTRATSAARGAGGGLPATGGGEEVYENTDFEPEQDTYYNAGDVPAEGRYSKLDPNTAVRSSKGEAYQPLSTDPSMSSSC